MLTITTQHGSFLFVDVPEGAANFTLYMNVLYYQIAPHLGVNDPMYSYSFNHDSNNYKFLCASDTATEQQAAEIVDRSPFDKNKYVLHDSNPNILVSRACDSALRAFASLLAHHKITGRQAILKQL